MRDQMDMVVCVRYVDGNAAIKTACRGRDPIFKAMQAGLGLLGVMTEFTIRTVPNTKTQVQVKNQISVEGSRFWSQTRRKRDVSDLIHTSVHDASKA
jgi:FAD/FMN-containing dehydrogenase